MAIADSIEINKGFRWPVRVYIEDTDAGGIVFYANYLRFMERARTEYMRQLGYNRLELLEPGYEFVVHSANIRYLKPARLDDLLWVTAQLKKVARTHFVFDQRVVLQTDESLLTQADIKVACIQLETLKPAALPASLVNSLQVDFQP